MFLFVGYSAYCPPPPFSFLTCMCVNSLKEKKRERVSVVWKCLQESSFSESVGGEALNGPKVFLIFVQSSQSSFKRADWGDMRTQKVPSSNPFIRVFS